MTRLYQLIRSDINFRKTILVNDGFNATLIKVLFADGISAAIFYRCMQVSLKNRWFKPLAFIFHKLNKFFNHCVIGMGADFGEGLALLHPVGIVINSKVVGGNYIAIESGVVIGSVRGESPSLCSDVYIGAGAKIIGPVNIGDHVKIGANAVVTKSVADHQTVVGIPANPI